MDKLNHCIKILISRAGGRASLNTLAWVLFLVCGVIYTAAAIRDKDPLMIAGSVCFVVAVIIFLVPDKK